MKNRSCTTARMVPSNAVSACSKRAREGISRWLMGSSSSRKLQPCTTRLASDRSAISQAHGCDPKNAACSVRSRRWRTPTSAACARKKKRSCAGSPAGSPRSQSSTLSWPPARRSRLG